MKSKLWLAICVGIGMGLGTILYGALSQGLSGVDWARAIYLAVFVFVVFLILPKSWVDLDKKGSSYGA